MRRGEAAVAIVGTLIGAAFGRLWLSTAAEGLQGWRGAVEAAGWVRWGWRALGLLRMGAAPHGSRAFASVADRSHREPGHMADAAPRCSAARRLAARPMHAPAGSCRRSLTRP